MKKVLEKHEKYFRRHQYVGHIKDSTICAVELTSKSGQIRNESYFSVFVCTYLPFTNLFCRHAALYVLEKDTSIHWKKVGIEGFFYFIERYACLSCICYSVCRSIAPYYSLLLHNQTDSADGDFQQPLDENIRFEVKEGTFFYQYDYRSAQYLSFLGLGIMVQ